MSCQRFAGRKTGNTNLTHRGLGATREHDISVIKRDQTSRITNSMRTRRARCHHCMIWPFKTKPDRDLPGNKIDKIARDKKWRDPAWTFCVETAHFILNAVQPANPRPGHHTASLSLFFGL